MSETEKELKPCAHCGGKAKLTSYIPQHPGEFNVGINYPEFYVFCTKCLTRTESDHRKEVIIAAWNRRTEAVPQWTSETPTEHGWYWVMIGESKGYVIVFVYEDEDDIMCVHHNGNPRSLPVDEYASMFHVYRWLRIPDPPLPAEREVKK
jgi:hypothetical protein